MNLVTRNGHNMYDMASMLQKAIRRNFPKAAMYAAYELYGRYYGMLWKRLVVISGEDCFGILTGEIMKLKELDDKENEGKKGYHRDFKYAEKAVNILCAAKKNRDACYLTCNFMIVDWGCSEKEFQFVGHIGLRELCEMINKDKEKHPEDQKKECYKQLSFVDKNGKFLPMD